MYTKSSMTLIAGLATLGLTAGPALAQSSSQQSTQAQQNTQDRQHTQTQRKMDQAQRSRATRDQPSAASTRPGTGQDRNAMLEDRVFVRLAEQAWAGGDFKISAQDGTVTISGTVPNEQSKQRMLRIAQRTSGVQDVRDQIRVDPSSGKERGGTAIPDEQLNKQVAEKIAAAIDGAKAGEDWWFTGWRVEGPRNDWSLTVDASDGRVTLDGQVPRHGLIRDAVEAALKVNGVRSVRSDLQLDARSYREARPYAYGHPYGWGPHGNYGGYPAYGRHSAPYGDDVADRRGTGDRDDARFIADRFEGQRTASNTSNQSAGGKQPAAMKSTHSMKGTHTMTGEVTSIDRQSGKVTVDTHAGKLNLHFPPSSLQNLQDGDRINVELGFQELSPARSGG
jgi:osmotically-inducible protein OsmY